MYICIWYCMSINCVKQLVHLNVYFCFWKPFCNLFLKTISTYFAPCIKTNYILLHIIYNIILLQILLWQCFNIWCGLSSFSIVCLRIWWIYDCIISLYLISFRGPTFVLISIYYNTTQMKRLNFIYICVCVCAREKTIELKSPHFVS